ncbi:hypothetical protein [Streptomyces griseus]|uniref:hypothetical protein n=1 Tax=Streptomyces griseus TaxID=1911 RepID=UPI0036BB2C43
MSLSNLTLMRGNGHWLPSTGPVMQLVVSSDRDRAYQLFSVLNDRGRSLGDADLLRSYTLEMVHKFPKHQGKVAELWDKILPAPSKEVSDFFLAYYPSKTGTRTGLPIFKKLRDEYFPNPEASNESEAESLINKVNEFREEMELFLKIRKGEWPYKSQPTPGVTPAITAWHKDHLRRLVISLKHELAMPLLLSAARTADEKKFAELAYMLEIFSFRYKNVCGGHATTPAKRYYIEAKNVRDSKAKTKQSAGVGFDLASRHSSRNRHPMPSSSQVWNLGFVTITEERSVVISGSFSRP